MADTVTIKKITDLPENTDANDADLFMQGVNGTASLRKIKWSTILAKIKSKLLANNLTTTQEGYALDARQGKALSDQINTLNTKTAPQGAFTNLWTPGAYIEGMGLGVTIPKKSGDTSLTITAVRIFTTSGWHNTNVLNVSDRINTWWVGLNDEGFTDLVSGNSYLVELTGSIS